MGLLAAAEKWSSGVDGSVLASLLSRRFGPESTRVFVEKTLYYYEYGSYLPTAPPDVARRLAVYRRLESIARGKLLPGLARVLRSRYPGAPDLYIDVAVAVAAFALAAMVSGREGVPGSVDLGGVELPAGAGFILLFSYDAAGGYEALAGLAAHLGVRLRGETAARVYRHLSSAWAALNLAYTDGRSAEPTALGRLAAAAVKLYYGRLPSYSTVEKLAEAAVEYLSAWRRLSSLGRAARLLGADSPFSGFLARAHEDPALALARPDPVAVAMDAVMRARLEEEYAGYAGISPVRLDDAELRLFYILRPR